MSQVDFYVLQADGDGARHQFACRLAEKAYRLNNTVHIKVRDADTMRQLDDLLWTFRDGSFVPHEISGAATAETASPVTVGHDDWPTTNPDLLINLGEAVPENMSSFPRVAEVVTSDEGSKAQSRERFAQYRDQGHTLNTHKL
ncbi:MAG: DNA polymerase III subunit chi [Woeseiaceae bacterium]